eukprot:scaffold98_cov307-Prasinococcus_capsulatus_cf.AAC.17
MKPSSPPKTMTAGAGSLYCAMQTKVTTPMHSVPVGKGDISYTCNIVGQRNVRLSRRASSRGRDGRRRQRTLMIMRKHAASRRPQADALRPGSMLW